MATAVIPGADPLDVAVAAVVNGEETTSDTAAEASAADESLEADVEASTSSEEAGEESPTEGGSTLFDKLLQKYGGDREKLAAGVFEQQNSASRLNDRLQAIEAALTAKNEEQFEDDGLEDIAVDHPDAEWVNQELTDLSAERTGNLQQKQALVTQIVAYDRQIAELTGESRRADDFEKARLEAQIYSLRQQKDADSKSWTELDKRNKTIDREERQFQRQAKLIEKQIDAEKSQIQKLREDNRALAQETVQSFIQEFTAEAKAFVIPDARVNRVANDVRRDVKEYLESLPSGAPKQNLRPIIKHFLTERMTEANIAKRAAQATKTEKKMAVSSKEPKTLAEATVRATKVSRDKLPENWGRMSNAQKASIAKKRAFEVLG